jgi:WD40 repeat protein/class 3 adenylate cyclase
VTDIIAHQQPLDGLPEGTITFMFTDVEGSTKLLDQLGEQYAVLLADQRSILREVFAKCHGQEVDTQGDAFFVSFSRASEAVSAAVEIQRALATHDWPSGVDVRLRMGLHTGEPWLVEEGYVGMDVHRAARIAHIGHGGQVLLSETTTSLVQDELPEGVELHALGHHRLKDIRRPEYIHQMVIEGLPVDFPPLNSLEVVSTPDRMEVEVAARLPRDVGPSPFKGLAAFHEEDADFFFGREAFTAQLSEALHQHDLVAVVVGSSGSGKSSAVFAGLLPKLRQDGKWLIASLRPGNQPFHALASALLPLLEPEMDETDRLLASQKLAEGLSAGEVTLFHTISRILQKQSPVSRLLMVADQFEELYTLCSNPEVREAFLDELLTTVKAGASQRNNPLALLLTLRADFMGQALTHRPFADALQEGSLMLGPMTRDELQAAIEKPAQLQGAAFEAGLVSRILDDVGEEPGNLPLLEFALTLLWERMDQGWMTHEVYDEIGRVEGALARYADEVYQGLTPQDQEGARKAFVQLVQPGQGTEDTRRVAHRVDLVGVDWGLVRHLADQRLVVTGMDQAGEETVEVVHEALIRGWGQLQTWMAADRDFRNWQEGLRIALRGWQDSRGDDGALLRGAPLAQAREWLAERGDEIGQVEKTYIQASVEIQEKRQRERERRRRLIFGGLVAGLVVTILLSVFAFQQRRASQRQSAILLARQAEVELADGYHDRAVLLALTALEDYPYTPRAEHALGQAVSYNRALQIYTPHQSAVTSIAWSPDGKLVASSASSDNNVHLWDPRTGETVSVIDMPRGITGNQLDMALNVSWTTDGKQLLTLNGDRYALGSQDYDLLLWDAASGDKVSSVEISNQAEPESGELDVTFVNYATGGALKIAPRSGMLATLGGDNTAILWDAVWGRPLVILRGHEGSVNSVDWSPDEQKVATASLDSTARIWDAQTGQPTHTLEGHDGRVNLAIWSSDGASLATAGEDGTLRLWDTVNGELVSSIETNAGPVSSLVWAPNSVRIVSGHEDGSLRIWEVASGELLETLRGHQGMISDLEWSPVDDRLASADGGGDVRVWNAASSTAWRLYPPQAARGGEWSVQGVDWSSDGRYLTTAGGDVVNYTEPGSFAIWDVQENQLTMENLGDALTYMGLSADFSPDDEAILYLGLQGFPDFSGLATAYIFDSSSGEIIQSFTPGGENLIRSAAWSPDGSHVATGLFSGEILIWDYQTGEQITKLVHNDKEFMVNYVEWSPDGSMIAAASDDSTARVWDTHTWEPLYTVQHEPPTFVSAAVWSPDGTRLLTAAGNDEQGAKDNTARIWDGATGEALLVFSGHTKSAWPGDWSPDGQRVATFSNDGTVKIWDAETGVELLELSVPVLYGGYAWWSPDGKHLAIAGLETLVSVWRVWQTTDELIAYAKECCLFRELTLEERQQFGLSAEKGLQ